MFFRVILCAIIGVQQVIVPANGDLATALETIRLTKNILKTVIGKDDENNFLNVSLLTQEYPDVMKTKSIIDEGIEIFHLGKEIAQNVTEVWKFVEDIAGAFNLSLNLKDLNIPDLPVISEERILNRMNDVSNQIRLLEATICNSATWTIESINKYMKLNTKLELTLHELSGLMYRLSSMDRTMRDLVENRETLERETLENFANMVVAPSATAVEGILDRIHVLVTGSPDFDFGGHGGVLRMVAADLHEAKWNLCTKSQSAQLIIYQMYSAITSVELKGFALMQFSWMLLKTYGKGNYTTEAALMRKRFNLRITRTHGLLKSVLETADKAIWRCDPATHVEGVTFVMLTGLMQGYVENEADLNNAHTCWKNCEDYQMTENFGCYSPKELCSRQRKCAGKVMKCQFMDADMTICPASSVSHRRYDNIKYKNGKLLGTANTCAQETAKVESWRRWIFWKCSYCFCHCDETSPAADRFINLRESVTSNNRVVTGVKFVKKYRIIHLQIQEGELLPRGHVSPNTTRWQPINDYTLLDRGIEEGVDYHSVEWNHRALDLDDLLAPTSYAVTGVRFRVLNTHLRLEIRITEMNFVSGLLNEQTSRWVSNDGSKRSSEVQLVHANVPTTTQKNQPNFSGSQFVQFQHSDIDLDAAQSTVPYLDAQEVKATPPVPLSGVGIYHKGHGMSGGFVAPKILTYNFASHIDVPSSPEKRRRKREIKL